MSHRSDIKVGSIWRSKDKRENGRLVTVVSTGSSVYGNDFVTVKSVRRSSLRTVTLLTRYELVSAPLAADQPAEAAGGQRESMAVAWDEGRRFGQIHWATNYAPEVPGKEDPNPYRTPPEPRVHNHAPWRPVCNERRLSDGQLRGACLNDDGSDR